MYRFIWKNTKYGPINPDLVKRSHLPVEVILTARNGTRLIRFEDGYEAAVMFYSVREV
jgi:hypothetical protein